MVIATTFTPNTTTTTSPKNLTMKHFYYPQRGRGLWPPDEHERFLEALKKYPEGPWRAIANHIGTRPIRQVQAHTRKYQQKLANRLHAVSNDKILNLCRRQRIDRDVIGRQTLIRLPGMTPFDLALSPRFATTTNIASASRTFGIGSFVKTNLAVYVPPIPLSMFLTDTNQEDLPILDGPLDFFIE